jgi:hypothetical protein
VTGDEPGTAADVSGEALAVVLPLQRSGDAELAGRHVERLLVVEDGAGVPGGTGHHQHLAGVVLDELRGEDADRGKRAVTTQGVEHRGDALALGRVRLDGDRLRTGDVVRLALAGPHVDLRGEGVAGGADDVAGVLGRELLAQSLVVLPGGRQGVAELVHQRLVVPEHGLGEVVAEAVHLAVHRARVEGARGEVIERRLGHEALVEHGGERLLTVGLLARPGCVVVLAGEHDVRPAAPGTVEQLHLRAERVGAVGRAVVGDDLDLGVRVGLLECLRGGLAVRIHPDGDRRGGVLAGFGKAV